jgi:hypothetical protein
MTGSEALHAMREGRKVARSVWPNGVKIWAEWDEKYQHFEFYEQVLDYFRVLKIYRINAQTQLLNDLTKDDWKVVE